MAVKNSTLTSERLRELLHYDQRTGKFVWRVNRGGRARAGTLAGSINCKGYICLMVDGTLYLAHRLAWLHVTGNWPDMGMEIDHKDGRRSENRFDNLRVGTKSKNQQNQRRGHVGSASGYLGVHWNKEYEKWRAVITVDGKKKLLGSFADPKLAHDAYLVAKRILHYGCTI